MAYIPPSGTINLCSGVKLNSRYEDTIYFNSAQEQRQYFESKVFRTLNQQSYIRKKGEIGVIHVDIPMYSAIFINYMYYDNNALNSSHEPKRYYCFVNKVEYVNEDVTALYFQIDVMQTYLEEIKNGLQECFVEREHSVTDDFYENTVPENLELGDSINLMKKGVATYPATGNTTDPNKEIALSYFFVTTTPVLDEWVQHPSIPTFYSNFEITGSYSPLYITQFMANTPLYKSELNRFITEYLSKKAETLVNAFIAPAWIGGGDPTTITLPHFVPSQYRQTRTIKIGRVGAFFNNLDETEDYYLPKNAKLFNYPYTRILVSTNNGIVSKFKPEDFTTNSSDVSEVIFEETGTVCGEPTLICVPQNHRSLNTDYDSRITITNFPKLPIVSNVYQTYIAQNGASLNASILSGVVGGGLSVLGGIATSNPIAIGGGLYSIASSVGNAYAKLSDLKDVPDQIRGSANSPMLNSDIGKLCFTYYLGTIKKEYAEKIDNYFSLYGYATNKVKTPNINVRQNWTFTKTIGCNINALMPNDDRLVICSIFDNGIRFWKNGDNIGQYGDFSNLTL